LSEPEWAFRYELEAELTFILRCEELYWQQRGRQQWILEGDANTAFFHAMANGRRRRCSILVMKDGNETLRDPVMI
jgi:mannosylglycoprotein endo-beta-mannosidase